MEEFSSISTQTMEIFPLFQKLIFLECRQTFRDRLGRLQENDQNTPEIQNASIYITVLLFFSFNSLAIDHSSFISGPIEPGSKVEKYDVTKVLKSRHFEKTISQNEKEHVALRYSQYFFSNKVLVLYIFRLWRTLNGFS